MSIKIDKINNDQNKVMSFIDRMNELEQQEVKEVIRQNDPIVKTRILNSEADKCRNDCVSHMMGNLFINAMPLDDDYKLDHTAELRDDMDKYLDQKGGPVYYLKSAYEKCNSPAIKKILEAADEEADDFTLKMGLSLNDKMPEDIKYRMSDDTKSKLDKITSDLPFKEITDIIRDNVTDTAVAEIEKAKKEKEFQEELETELKNRTDVTSEAAVDDILARRGLSQPKIYQPSLFEAMVIGKTKDYAESGRTVDTDTVFGEAVKDYTLYSLTKALKLEKFTIESTKSMANDLIR